MKRKSHRLLQVGMTGVPAAGKTASSVLWHYTSIGRWIVIDNADALVHSLYQNHKPLIAIIARRCPAALGEDGGIDRSALAAMTKKDPTLLGWLEDVVHPLLSQQRMKRARTLSRMGIRVVVYDVPLLFETGLDRDCNTVITVSAPAWLRQQRLKKRQQSLEYWNFLQQRQWSQERKRLFSDCVVPTSIGRRFALTQLQKHAKKTLNIKKL